MAKICKTCGAGTPAMTLKRLIAREGADTIAALLEVSESHLLNMRSGQRPTRLAALCRLRGVYPDFDIEATVMVTGPKREKNIAKAAAKAESE